METMWKSCRDHVKTHMEMHFHAPFAARPVVPLGGAEARVTLASVGDEYVVLPLQGGTASRAGFLPAGGLVAGPGGDPGTGHPDPAHRGGAADPGGCGL